MWSFVEHRPTINCVKCPIKPENSKERKCTGSHACYDSGVTSNLLLNVTLGQKEVGNVVYGITNEIYINADNWTMYFL